MLDSLHRRSRGKALARVLSGLTGGRVPARYVPTAAELEAAAARRRAERLVGAVRRHAPSEHDDRTGPVSRALLDRLDEADVSEVRRRLDAGLGHVWQTADPVARERLKLVLGVHFGIAEILAKTGLRQDQPPADVHAMARGPLAAGGDFWTADLIAGTAERCGLRFAAGTRVLDFGCSSGRHLRVLQAWRPEVNWFGCDPNERAIAWAREHLPGTEFFVSPQEPPLELEPRSLDLVSAISVWSHFGAGAAERWLSEMHRIVRPGGLLVFTTQGFGSVAHYLRTGSIPPEHAADAADDLIAVGHHFRDAFGEQGDWGIKSAEWGTAYMTLEWLVERATPSWSLALYEATRVEANQNLVMLRREADS